MPKFLTPSGSPCTADEAKPLGRLRPGYSEVISDGESIGFDTAFMDSAQRSGAAVYLTDSNERASIRTNVDREEAAHDHKFAFMGDAAPKFDRERAEFLARNRASAQADRQIRDMVVSGYHAPLTPSVVAKTENAGGNAQQVRDAVRNMRYAG